ncbi:MAG: hypothetical protein SV186_00100 [Candidatus Nanohaloarchaea archaeon]|nr:hypothetical protein [Candidatus Nanohaloarchaea archaeon]
MNDEQIKRLMQKDSPNREDIQQFAQLLPESDKKFLKHIYRNGPTSQNEIVNALTFIDSQELAQEYIEYYEPLLSVRGGSSSGSQISIDPERADIISFIIG